MLLSRSVKQSYEWVTECLHCNARIFSALPFYKRHFSQQGGSGTGRKIHIHFPRPCRLVYAKLSGQPQLINFLRGNTWSALNVFASLQFPKVDPPEAQSFVELQKIKKKQQVEMDCNFLSKQFIYVNFEFSRMPRVLTVPLHTFSSLTCQWIPVIWMGWVYYSLSISQWVILESLPALLFQRRSVTIVDHVFDVYSSFFRAMIWWQTMRMKKRIGQISEKFFSQQPRTISFKVWAFPWGKGTELTGSRKSVKLGVQVFV